MWNDIECQISKIRINRMHYDLGYDILVPVAGTRRREIRKNISPCNLVLAPEPIHCRYPAQLTPLEHHRFMVPVNGLKMEAVCEVRNSRAHVWPTLGSAVGLGVFAKEDLHAGASLYWDLTNTTLCRLCTIPAHDPIRRYAFKKEGRRADVVVLCPNQYLFRHSSDPLDIGIGFRVNFAGPGDTVNCSSHHSGDFGMGLKFVVHNDGIKRGEELLFLPDFHCGVAKIGPYIQ